MSARLTGLVLAGGRSTRMGRDKATLIVDGERLVDRAVAVLAQCCDEVLLAAAGRPLSVAGARTISDAELDAGPLAGIVAGLEAAATDLVAVIAVDLPDASAAVLDLLAATWEGEAGVAPLVDGVMEPLHAVYATAAAGRYADLLRAGERSPRRALEGLGARLVGPEEWGTAAADGRFARSLNSPGDLVARPRSEPPPGPA